MNHRIRAIGIECANAEQFKRLCTIKKIREIYITGSDIDCIPEEIGQLSSLRTLMISRTKISALPDIMLNLKELQSLFFDATPLEHQVPNEIREIIYFVCKQQKQKNDYYFNESKMIVVGQGNVGKSCLVERITKNKYKDKESTEGIDVKTWQYTIKKKKYNFFLFADTAVTGLVLGQIIGRFGNFMNREAFGEYTDSLFAMRLKVSDVTSANITSTMREHISIQDGIRYIQVHPTFLYEAAWNVLVLTAMLLYTKKKKFDGEIFLIYLIGYGLGRAWIEGLRTDQLQIGTTGIAVSQVLSAGGLVVAGVVVWIYRMRRLKKKEK